MSSAGSIRGVSSRHATAPHRRPAQHLQSRGDARPGLRLRRRRPSQAAHLTVICGAIDEQDGATSSIRRSCASTTSAALSARRCIQPTRNAIGRAFGTMVASATAASGWRWASTAASARPSSPGALRRGPDARPASTWCEIGLAADADALFRGLALRRRRRHADHRLAQSARLQRLQDDDGQEVVLRRRHPEAGRDRRQGRLRDRPGQGVEKKPSARPTMPRACCRTSSPAASSRSPGTPATARSACRSAPWSTSCRASISC